MSPSGLKTSAFPHHKAQRLGAHWCRKVKFLFIFAQKLETCRHPSQNVLRKFHVKKTSRAIFVRVHDNAYIRSNCTIASSQFRLKIKLTSVPNFQEPIKIQYFDTKITVSRCLQTSRGNLRFLPSRILKIFGLSLTLTSVRFDF